MKNEKILIFGDSYSTFKGYIPEGYAFYYPREGHETVNDVSKTWWNMLAAETGSEIVLNNSWSGSTVCNTGYSGDCSKTSSFICRLEKLIGNGFFENNELDRVFVFGGTNDSWSKNACGKLMFEGWTPDDLFRVLPGICYFVDRLVSVVPREKIHIIINTGLGAEITDGLLAICEHYGLKYTKLSDIDKVSGHPTFTGMTAIKDQVLADISELDVQLNCELAMSTCGVIPDEELFRSYAENGVKAIEVSLGLKACEELNYGRLKHLSDKYNVKLWSFHFPFSPFSEIDISNPELAEHTVELLKKLISKANEIGIKTFVIHASGEPISEDERSSRMICAKNSLKILAEYATELGCVIAVEDLPRSCLGNCSDDILELLSAHDDLRVCFDTNHLLNEDIVNFIDRVGEKIVTIHASDYDFVNERHWLPGEGKIDWASLMIALYEVGYRGYWLYELGYSTPWSIDRPRELKVSDFKRNYDELMQTKRPSAFGRAKENLGMWKLRD